MYLIRTEAFQLLSEMVQILSGSDRYPARIGQYNLKIPGVVWLTPILTGAGVNFEHPRTGIYILHG